MPTHPRCIAGPGRATLQAPLCASSSACSVDRIKSCIDSTARSGRSARGSGNHYMCITLSITCAITCFYIKHYMCNYMSLLSSYYIMRRGEGCVVQDRSCVACAHQGMLPEAQRPAPPRGSGPGPLPPHGFWDHCMAHELTK